MATLANLVSKFILNVKPTTSYTVCYRYKSKKSRGNTRNAGNANPKHRGWKIQDGGFVHMGQILATQNKTRWHPGLHVGFGRNGTLFAKEDGIVMVTTDLVNPDWKNNWIKRNYEGYEGCKIYKKHFNVIPEPQHNRFKLIDTV